MQRNKSTKTEKIILVILILVLITVIIWSYCVFTGTHLFKGKHDETYEITHLNTYSIDISESFKWDIPYQDKIADNSYFKINITDTDDYIKEYNEELLIIYNDLSEKELEEVKTFCNKYNEIYYNYQLLCTNLNNTIKINNEYSLEELNGNKSIKTEKKNYEIPVTYNQEYQKYIDSIGVNPERYLPAK